VPASQTSIERLTKTERRHNQVRDHSLPMPLKVSGNNMGGISVKRFANELNSYFMDHASGYTQDEGRQKRVVAPCRGASDLRAGFRLPLSHQEDLVVNRRPIPKRNTITAMRRTENRQSTFRRLSYYASVRASACSVSATRPARRDELSAYAELQPAVTPGSARVWTRQWDTKLNAARGLKAILMSCELFAIAAA
jgi:hypothetical protein